MPAREKLGEVQNVLEQGEVKTALIRKILLPTDFSRSSAVALARAVALANQCGAAITILHVIDINAQPEAISEHTGQDLMKQLWGEGSARMAELAWSLRGQVEARTTVQEGLPWEVIAHASRDFDIIVMGNGSVKSGSRIFSQHTAQRVLESAACPVLVVH